MISSRLQMMDPKMDRGLIREGGKRLEVFRQDFLLGLAFSPLGDLEEHPELTAAAMDSLFRLEATFLGNPGKSFSETLGISLLTHRPEYLERGNPALVAFTRGVVRGVEMTAGLVRAANVTGSEDFNQRGLNQAPDLTRAGLDPSVDQLIALLDRQGKTAVSDGIRWHCKRLCLWLQIANLAAQAEDLAEKDWIYFDGLLDALLAHLEPSVTILEYELKDVGIFKSMANLSPMGCPKLTLVINSATEAILSSSTLLRALKMVPRLLLEQPRMEFRRLCFEELRGESWNPIVYSLLFVALHGSLEFDPAISSHLMDVLQVQCHSPARRRRLWPKLLAAIDQSLPLLDAPLGEELRWWRWRGSVEIVLLGFPLELYVPREYAQVLWVLSKLYKSNSLLECARAQIRSNLPVDDPHQVFIEAAFHKRFSLILAPLSWSYADFYREMLDEPYRGNLDSELLRLLASTEPTIADLCRLTTILSPPSSYSI
jgi:hypothetical protein